MEKKRPTFEDALIRLNSKNLDALLEGSSLLSSIEFSEGMDSPLFPLLNNEKCRLFSEAICRCKAAHYKSATLTYDDLSYALNGTTDALNDPRLSKELAEGKSDEERQYSVQKFFARMANIQIRQQEIRSSATVGRLLAMLLVMPQRHLDQFGVAAPKMRQFAEGLPRSLGAGLRELATIYMLLSLWHNRLSHIALKLLAPNRAQLNQAPMIYKLWDLAPSLREYISFSRESLERLAGFPLPEAAFTAFISLFSRSMLEIRMEAKKSTYNIGPEGWQLSPLERFPIVTIDNQVNDQPQRFIIPNIRTFMRSFGDVIHFTLQEKFGNSYNEIRGSVQEVYIRLLVQERLPAPIDIIPEISYRSSKGEKKGPDCTIVEKLSHRLIVVEAKARRVLAETRFTMEEEVFDTNFAQVYDLLLRLKDKVADLYAGLPEYALYQAAIDSTAQNSPICVAVIGESVYMMNEIIRYRARTESEHPLKGFPWIYCVMSLESFELAVEFAATENVPLAQILGEFWEDSSTTGPAGHMSDLFRERAIKKGSSFAESFIKASDLLVTTT